MVLTAVGGFPELAEQGAARIVAARDPLALAGAMAELIADSGARAELSSAAARAAAGPYSWDRAARLTLSLYAELLAGAD
jgi:glycosyltransferase involved in cell wall biosynthesis